MPDTPQNNTAATGELNVEWSYSGKALRAQAISFVLVSLILVGSGIYATVAGWYGAYYLSAWIGKTICLVLLWGYHYGIYFYRTYTIRYLLNERHLCSFRGLFTRVRDTQELVHVDDVQLTQTLFDRIFNGGVGTLVIFSASDRTNSKLILTGIDNPQKIFDLINTARTSLRAQRSILTGGG